MNSLRSLCMAALISGTLPLASWAEAPTLTYAYAIEGSGGDLVSTALSEPLAADGIAILEIIGGQLLTQSVQDLAEHKLDIVSGPFFLVFLLRRGAGLYSTLGREVGAEFASNLRLLYPYLGQQGFFLIAYEDTGIDSWDDIKGRKVHDGPLRGGAVVVARSIIKLSTGFEANRDYTAVEVEHTEAISIFMDRSVDASVRTGSTPAPWMEVLATEGRVNLISIPAEKYENNAFRTLRDAPGFATSTFSVPDAQAAYGDAANVISEDDTFRAVATTFGDLVHKDMDFDLAKALTTSFIENVENINAMAPFAPSLKFGNIDGTEMGVCAAGLKLHPGAQAAWEEAGFAIDDCMKAEGS